MVGILGTQTTKHGCHGCFLCMLSNSLISYCQLNISSAKHVQAGCIWVHVTHPSASTYLSWWGPAFMWLCLGFRASHFLLWWRSGNLGEVIIDSLFCFEHDMLIHRHTSDQQNEHKDLGSFTHDTWTRFSLRQDKEAFLLRQRQSWAFVKSICLSNPNPDNCVPHGQAHQEAHPPATRLIIAYTFCSQSHIHHCPHCRPWMLKTSINLCVPVLYILCSLKSF